VRSKGNKVSVVLVHDHAVVREGYRRLLERQASIAVIAEASDAATAHPLFCRLQPQIAVLDISLPGTSGIGAMRRMLVHNSGACVLIFSTRTRYSDGVHCKPVHLAT
jgi:two-component system invasion response regulator UvrY